MPTMLTKVPILAITLVGLLARPGVADTVSIVPQQPCSSLFGGQDVTLRYQVKAASRFQGRAAVAVEVQDRVVVRRELQVRTDQDGAGQLQFPVQFPATRPGVVLGVVISIAIDGSEPFRHPLWIFPDDPFAHQRQAYEELRLCLYDPQGKTVRRFQESSIPFRQLHHMDELAGFREGMLIIGEGVSFRDRRGLAELMIEIAGRGVPVLCLAPAAGSLPLPGLNPEPGPAPTGLAFRRNDIITEFDKRFDAEAWCSDAEVIASSVVPTIDRRGLIGEISMDGWPWVDFDFPAERGRLVVCGFAIIDQWQAGPTPRFLLAAILQSFPPMAPGNSAGTN